MRRTLSLLVVLFLFSPISAFAGSQTFSTPGTYTFAVPAYSTLTVQAWGGGGGGQVVGINNQSYDRDSTSGGGSSFNGSLLATGGTRPVTSGRDDAGYGCVYACGGDGGV